MKISAHAYPWDVLGDPGFVDRVRASGVDAVRLAVTYHATRAATPLHPRRRFVDAHYAALYRPIRPASWAGQRLVPKAPQWMDEPDPAGAATDLLHRAGIPVEAWLVLAHNTRLGRAYPQLAVTNCFGEPYPYALCPSQVEVRDHCATLAAEALRDLPLSGVLLESAGQLGASHAGGHEKTEGAYGSLALRALSVCCCAACQRGWAGRGVAPGEVTARLRDAVRSDRWLPEALASAVLAVRQDAADQLRGQVLSVVRQVVPGAGVTLAGHPDPWATGPSPGLTPRAPSDVDAVQVPCWPVAEQTADVVRGVPGALVDAYVTVLPPAAPEALPDHVRRLRAAGAQRLSLYHLGLASPRRLPLLAALAKDFRPL